jgi:hypothetical protein
VIFAKFVGEPPAPDRRVFLRLAGLGAVAVGVGALAGCSSSTFTPEQYAGHGEPTSAHIERAVDAAVAHNGVVRLSARRYAGNLTLADDAVVHGAGEGESVIGGALLIGSRVRLKGVTVRPSGTHSSFRDGAHDSVIDGVAFHGGSSWGNLYINDRSTRDHRFTRCTFAHNVRGGNGVRIVDKGTSNKHVENIRFESCHFHDNHRMNFECIQRADAGNPVRTGYRSIDLVDCVFEASGGINVSYDSGLLHGSEVDRSSGYSAVRGCSISGGGYGLELAGASHMLVQDTTIQHATGMLLSTSQVGPNPANTRFVGNTLTSHVRGANVVFSGTGNTIRGNTVHTPGQVRFATCGDTVVSGNTFTCADDGPTTISIEKSFDLEFVDNTIVGGARRSVLQLDRASVHNSFTGNDFRRSATAFDLRNGTELARSANSVDPGGGTP